jgi:hypothetical protein
LEGLTVKLYHVTTSAALQSVLNRGVDPRYSKGKQLLSWWVDEKRMLYGLAHASARHEMPVGLLIIVSAYVDADEIRPTRWAGVYTAAATITVATFEVGTQWLRRQDDVDADN